MSKNIMKKITVFATLTYLVIFNVLCGCSADKPTITKQEKTEQIVSNSNSTPTPMPKPTTQISTELNYAFLDYNMFDEYLANGTYRCGTDFEPGNYYMLSLYGAMALYGASDNPPDSGYDDIRVFRKLNIKDGQYIALDGAILVKASLIGESDLTRYGIYKVGVDIAEGEYKCEAISDDYNTDLGCAVAVGGYQINKGGMLDGSGAIKSDWIWKDKPDYIKIENGDIVAINNLHITLVK